jgi:hypothetical protein
MYTEERVSELKNLIPIWSTDLKTISITLPDCVEIKKIDDQTGLYSTKSFKKGELIYRAALFIIDNLDAFNNGIKLETNKGTFDIIPHVHTVTIGNKFMVFTFDSFMNHECAPNTKSKWEININNKLNYFDTYAEKDIEIGDQLTCNYLLFWYKDDEGFNCECGSENCFRWVEGYKQLSKEQQLKLEGEIDPVFYSFFNNEIYNL